MRSTKSVRTCLRALLAGLAASAATGVVAPAHAATDPLTANQWGLDLVRARAAWNTGRGAGATIAVVDSGADLPHEDLAPNLVAGRSLVSDSPQDDDGHGTHVSGIAAGVGNNGRGISGVAPAAKVMPIKALTPDGGTIGDVADAIRLAADSGAAVINLSLGPDVPLVFSAFDSSFSDAIRYAWSKGSISVLAAGNNSLPISDYGDLPAIVVTAVDRRDRRAGYATAVGGARWGMAAPGGAANGNAEDDVLSTFWTSGRSNSYGYLAGTSMAAPFVSGAAAILRGLGLSPQATVDRLLATATDLGATGRDSTFGSGRLDVARAVSGLGSSGPGPSDTTPSGNPSSPTRSSPATTTRGARSVPNPSASGSAPTVPTVSALPSDSPSTTAPEIFTDSNSDSERESAPSANKLASPTSSERSSPVALVAGGVAAMMTAATAVALSWRARRNNA